ncbi:MAG TPA: helix-hairpin-helix domain-containing protein [Allosphingosinicella sp.]|jgi:DNA uptake protein ComE-like DNA-binding protein|nr:helix-hairpin-helix domain-containing protein [Allosphingosinicella sp.]
MSAVDLNSADKDALDAVEGLEGHGPEIVRYRDERGGFTELRHLEEVPGLTGKITDAIRARLTIGE